MQTDDPVILEHLASELETFGELQKATQVYIYVAEIYLEQHELDKAVDNWIRATQLTPDLLSVHARLAKFYERKNDRKNAIREYLTLASSFVRVGNHNYALQSLERAMRLNEQTLMPLNPSTDISRNEVEMGITFTELLDFDQSTDRITTVSNENNYLQQVEELFQENLSMDALTILDNLLKDYAIQGQIEQLTKMLETLTSQFPHEIGLRSRLAALYNRLGHKRKTIEQLDILGELQIDAGLHKDAANTIRQIMDLGYTTDPET